ncbi:MAG: Glu-tRNA(Gln) amidotransferase subunit GatD [Candidatus Nanohaloarchaeota archaeon QJJ-5]|nr:Glu-tRNA(Gln) amidotransferase subunit GatD [Candidatus Nanohaloarchaeota archaeon QJJ-5]
MYSQAIQDILEEKDISAGDRIEIDHDAGTHEGRLMPRANQGNTDAVVLKLDNGYNLGIDRSSISSITKQTDHDTADEPDIDIPDYDEDKTDIAVLHTGGTIASRVSYEEGGVTPAFDPEDLLQMYPELFERANVESEVIAQMLSEDMEPAHWQQIAEAVADHRDKDGIVIGHGTDTMQYTAAALSFMLENIDIPILLVGAQRSSDRPSSDAALNLIGAARFIEEQQPGVYVCMHHHSSDTSIAIHRGTQVRKMHTSRRDAFQTIDGEPIATVDTDDWSVSFNDRPKDPDGAFELRTTLETNIGHLKTRPGMRPDELAPYTDRAGLIMEGTGLGHLPVNSFDEHTDHHTAILEKLDTITDDAVVAMTSQCLHGRINMNVYDAGVKIQDAGVVSAGAMMPETAYVKLMWSLGQTETREQAIELFQTNIAGENPPRETHDAYRSEQ